jgi:hypothetical protein
MMTTMLRTATALLMLSISLGISPGRAEVPRIVLDAASAAVTELQIIGPGETGSPLRWATWMAGAQPGPHAVWLALLRRDQGKSTAVWSASRVDGYLPRIRLLTNWAYRGEPTLLFTYQMGAEAEELELYGLTSKGSPLLLGTASAAEFFPIYRDGFFIEAQGLLHEPRTCLRFDAAQGKLWRGGCPD